ncbi:MAG: cupin domain-containing protein [Bacteroidales bacterium]
MEKKMYVLKASKADYKKSESWDTWEKEESEFPWKYPANETCLILKGSATVRDFEGNEIRFGEGDLVHFPKGLECIWKIHSKIEKKYLLY